MFPFGFNNSIKILPSKFNIVSMKPIVLFLFTI